ncbi:MAG: class I SAM-dependent methyltransferase [Candidatus Thermoplasmatota archaeon]|nr:class I SAM-dependent methyltransferase [Candidatus Thermoplasmatota archaeon]
MTAVIATNGYYVNKGQLIRIGKEENNTLLKYLDKSRNLLEFGSGIGKNLIAISDHIKFGYGIDINPYYCRIAKILTKRFGIQNLLFFRYDGKSFPSLPKFDIIYENGVFERLPKEAVTHYVETLRKDFLSVGGMMILYFLNENAKHIGFTKRLGDSAYVFWTKEEITDLTTRLGLKQIDVHEWPMAYVYVLSDSDTLKSYFPHF